MATRQVMFGTLGPFEYDDEVPYDVTGFESKMQGAVVTDGSSPVGATPNYLEANLGLNVAGIKVIGQRLQAIADIFPFAVVPTVNTVAQHEDITPAVFNPVVQSIVINKQYLDALRLVVLQILARLREHGLIAP